MIRIQNKEKQRRLEAHFRKLPIKAGPAIPYETLLPDICRDLVQMSWVPPRGKPAKELKTLKRHAEQLRKAIRDLHKPALELRVVPRGLSMRLGLAIAAIDAASLNGAPRKIQARNIAEKTAETYYRLTGLDPHVNVKRVRGKGYTGGEAHKDYGDFPDLLAEVFKILGVEAKATSQTRSLRKAKTPV